MIHSNLLLGLLCLFFLDNFENIIIKENDRGGHKRV
jgi:hypothetical protein